MTTYDMVKEKFERVWDILFGAPSSPRDTNLDLPLVTPDEDAFLDADPYTLSLAMEIAQYAEGIAKLRDCDAIEDAQANMLEIYPHANPISDRLRVAQCLERALRIVRQSRGKISHLVDDQAIDDFIENIDNLGGLRQ